ncbi:Bro-N domain-containing protein [Sellimonas intestinalis]|uniref:BRO-N domain-containing protein n=1 Tax=Sellimonas intestinalis TaxID=1653434 RepID=UPI0039910B8A
MDELKNNGAIQLFEDKKIRTAWDEKQEEWYFSIVDVISVLTGTENPRRYWSDLKRKLKAEGAVEVYEKIVQLKMTAPDGKKRLTDVANTEQLLRIIQSVPSPKAEPFKAWLAMVGRERIEETIDPEQAIDRALDTYLKKGYSEEWVHQRLLAIRIRNELTDEWKRRGVEKGKEYAILTDEISRAWSGMTTREYKKLKGLKKENLRDNMSDLELVLTMLAEASTTDISKTAKPKEFSEHQDVARRGGKVAGIARQALEAETGKPVITSQNAKDFRQLITDIVEDAASIPEYTETEEKTEDESEDK